MTHCHKNPLIQDKMAEIKYLRAARLSATGVPETVAAGILVGGKLVNKKRVHGFAHQETAAEGKQAQGAIADVGIQRLILRNAQRRGYIADIIQVFLRGGIDKVLDLEHGPG